MAKDPAFLFYSQDFFTGTATLSFEDKGKFIHLLCLMHQQGRMQEETIRFLVGSFSDNLKRKFKIDANGFYYNERMEAEAKKRNDFTESRRHNGANGGRPKKETKPHAKAKKNHTDNRMANENVNEDSNTNANVIAKTPLEIAFNEFLEMRKKIRKPTTPRAIELVKNKLVQMSNNDEELAIKILNQSIVNSWQDIYPLKNVTNATTNTTRNDREAQRLAGIEQLKQATTAILGNGGANQP